MRSVWSFWTKPLRAGRSWNWPSDKHHLLAWILSVETARKHYPKTSLITDDFGVKILIDGLGLGFDQVSTELNTLEDQDPAFWMLGKLYAYRAQTEPFIHLDTDIFLWKRLQAKVENAPVFAQNPEPFAIGASHYQPEKMKLLMTERTDGWVPPEWDWALSFGNPQRGECCGVLGGNRVDFIRYYADTAIKMIEDKRNEAGWAFVANKGGFITSIEQYHLAACVDYHRNRPDSRFRQVEIRYVFDSFAHAFNSNMAEKLGFTHLQSSAKQSKVLAERLEKRVKRDYSEQYQRCIRFKSELIT
jgi:hypothetical protein